MSNLKDERILVTGAGGFIGSHLVERLLDEGCKVRAFILYNSFNSWGWLDTLSKEKIEKIEIFSGDVRDQNSVRKAMKGINMVFHLAALISIPYSYNTPDSFVGTNINGTLNVLQTGVDFGTKRLFVTSTSEVYGTALSIPIEETHSLQAQSPYSATKIGADKLAESFYRSFDTPVTIVRPFNTYGPRQSARAIIPTIITQLLNGSSELRLGSLKPARDFNFIKDTCDAFIAIANSEKTIGEEINIASGKMITIGELTKKIINKINPDVKVTHDEARIRPWKSEVIELLGSNKKITSLTGWSPQYSFDRGLDETIEWFKNKENMKIYKPDIYNV